MKAHYHYFITQPRLWWWVLCICILSFLAGFVQYEKNLEGQLEQLETEHINMLSSANSIFSRELGDLRNSTRLLASHLQDLITDTPEDGANVEAVFQRVGSILPKVSQIRWLALNGDEIFRVDFKGLDVTAVPPVSLQNKRNRPYFNRISQTLPGELMLSKINLNVENGDVVMPFEPTIRALIHSPANHPLGEGYLVVNFRLTALFSFLHGLNQPSTDLLVAYGQDSWLMHYDKSLEWSTSLNTRPANIAINTPNLWAYLSQAKAVSVKTFSNGDVFSANQTSIRYSEKDGDHERIYFIARTQSHVYAAMIEKALIPAGITAVLVFLLCCILLYREIALGLTLEKLTAALNREKDELANALRLQKQLQDELVETEKMASLGMLVAGVAHEMNTPLGAAVMSVSDIQTRLDTLRSEIAQGLKKSTLDNYLNSTAETTRLTLSNLQRASSLIKRFKRLAVDRSSEDCTQFNLYQCINDLLRAMQPQLKQHNINIEIQCSKTIYMNSFPGILSQILQNLINNCVHHAFDNVRNPAITIDAHADGNTIRLTVADNGQGISEEMVKTIFEPFITTNRKQGNTGLGLHLVHQWISQVMAGKIQVRTDTGTQFIMYLPVSVKTGEDD